MNDVNALIEEQRGKYFNPEVLAAYHSFSKVLGTFARNGLLTKAKFRGGSSKTGALFKGSLLHEYVEKGAAFWKTIPRPPEKTPTSEKMVEFCEYIAARMDHVESMTELVQEAKKATYKSMTADVAEERFQEYIEYIIFLRDNAAKTLMPKSTYDDVDRAYKALQNNKFANYLLFNNDEDVVTVNELPIYWQVGYNPTTQKVEQVEELEEDVLSFLSPEGDVKRYNFKSLIDRVRIMPNEKKVFLIDLKSHSKAHFGQSYTQWGYYYQLPFYYAAFHYWLGTATAATYLAQFGINALEVRDYEVKCFFVPVYIHKDGDGEKWDKWQYNYDVGWGGHKPMTLHRGMTYPLSKEDMYRATVGGYIKDVNTVDIVKNNEIALFTDVEHSDTLQYVPGWQEVVARYIRYLDANWVTSEQYVTHNPKTLWGL